MGGRLRWKNKWVGISKNLVRPMTLELPDMFFFSSSKGEYRQIWPPHPLPQGNMHVVTTGWNETIGIEVTSQMSYG